MSLISGVYKGSTYLKAKRKKYSPAKKTARKSARDFSSKVELANYMRSHPTSLESILANRIKRVIGKRFIVQSQVMVCGYIADFLIPELLLVIEADGPLHANQRDYDSNRNRVMENKGYHVLRFSGRNLTHNPQRVESLIKEKIATLDKRILQDN